MALPSTMETELSPLDQIRMAEANVVRKIALSRELAECIVAQARFQARLLVDEAKESGQRDGQAQYKEITSKAEEEAGAIVTASEVQAEDLRCKGCQHMDLAVHQIVNAILCLGLEEKV
jgi:vacuolar-type H+-ATPase subunit H